MQMTEISKDNFLKSRTMTRHIILEATGELKPIM